MDSKALVDFVMDIMQAGAATFLVYGAWLCFRHTFSSAAGMDLSQAAMRSMHF
jgi:hypothetical protein